MFCNAELIPRRCMLCNVELIPRRCMFCNAELIPRRCTICNAEFIPKMCIFVGQCTGTQCRGYFQAPVLLPVCPNEIIAYSRNEQLDGGGGWYYSWVHSV